MKFGTIILLLLLTFCANKILAQESPADSIKTDAYMKYNELVNSNIVKKYYTREQLDEIYKTDIKKIAEFHKYFFNSYKLIPINEFNGLRKNLTDFDVFEFENFRKKDSRFSSTELLQGYNLVLLSDNEIGNIVPQTIKDKAIKKHEKKVEKKNRN